MAAGAFAAAIFIALFATGIDSLIAANAFKKILFQKVAEGSLPDVIIRPEGSTGEIKNFALLFRSYPDPAIEQVRLRYVRDVKIWCSLGVLYMAGGFVLMLAGL